MNLTLSQDEIKRACAQYIRTLGIDTEHKNVKVHLVAGRGTKGHSAEVSVTQFQELEDAINPNKEFMSKAKEHFEEEITVDQDTETKVETSLFENEN